MLRALICFLGIFLLRCDFEKCPRYGYQNQFSYRVTPTVKTAKGIAVDTTGQDVSLERVDSLTDEVGTCLLKTFGNPSYLPDGIRQTADCLHETFALPIERKCFVVKIPDDWELSCNGRQQVLPQEAPAELCRAKGLEPTPECPCRWRAGIQDDSVIVTTPNLFLYKDPLIRLTTGCNNPWAHPSLAACAQF